MQKGAQAPFCIAGRLLSPSVCSLARRPYRDDHDKHDDQQNDQFHKREHQHVNILKKFQRGRTGLLCDASTNAISGRLAWGFAACATFL
jgi:hypothetical protein